MESDGEGTEKIAFLASSPLSRVPFFPLSPFSRHEFYKNLGRLANVQRCCIIVYYLSRK